MAEQRLLLVDYPGVAAGERLEKDASGHWRGLMHTGFWIHDDAVAVKPDHFAEPVALEIAANLLLVSSLGSLAVPTFAESTVAQNVAALRALYSSATKEQAIMIGDCLSAQTDARLRAAFSLTAEQVTTLRTNKLTPAAAAATAIRNATGA